MTTITRDALISICIDWDGHRPIQIDYESVLWDEVYKYVVEHKLSGLFKKYIETHCCIKYLPKSIVEANTATLARMKKKRQDLYSEFDRVNNRFLQDGIKAVIVKGKSFERYFPVDTRCSWDIDLVAAPDDMHCPQLKPPSSIRLVVMMEIGVPWAEIS